VTTLPAGFVDDTSPDGSTVTWEFTLGEGAVDELLLGLYAPFPTGDYQITTQVLTVNGAVTVPYGPDLDLIFHVTSVANLFDEAFTLAYALPVQQTPYMALYNQGLGYLEFAQIAWAAGDFQTAILHLLTSIDRFKAMETLDVTDIRLALDRLLQEAEKLWAFQTNNQ